MVYTKEEKARMDVLLDAFSDYVASHKYFDVVYSDKAGFLRICVGEGADQIYFPITGFDDMLRMLVDDFLQDEETRVEHFLHRDYDRVRMLLAPILDKLGDDRALGYQIMEKTIDDCKLKCEQLRRQRLTMIRETEDLLEKLRNSIKA